MKGSSHGFHFQKGDGVFTCWAKCPGQQLCSGRLIAVTTDRFEERVPVLAQTDWNRSVVDKDAAPYTPITTLRVCYARDQPLGESLRENAAGGFALPMPGEKRVSTLATGGFLVAGMGGVASPTGSHPIRL
jgi:hypothetical protein